MQANKSFFILQSLNNHTVFNLRSQKDNTDPKAPTDTKMKKSILPALLCCHCTAEDKFSRVRFERLLKWVQKLCSKHSEQTTCSDSIAEHLHCIASILWHAHATKLVPDLDSQITALKLFDALHKWHTNWPSVSLSAMLCSICAICPDNFKVLLQHMRILDSDHDVNDLGNLNIGTKDFESLAIICQSDACMKLFMDLGIPGVLTYAVLEYCQRGMPRVADENIPLVCTQKVAEILNFLAEIAGVGSIRDWLGSYEGSLFWEPLIQSCCNRRTPKAEDDAYPQLEDAVINFMVKMTVCHPKNQDLFTTVLVNAIRVPKGTDNLKKKVTMSDFSRRLILRVLLGKEKVLVFVNSKQAALKSPQPASPPHPKHFPHPHQIHLTLDSDASCANVLKEVALCISISSEELNDATDKPSAHDLGLYKELLIAGQVNCKDFDTNYLAIIAGDSKKFFHITPTCPDKVGTVNQQLKSPVCPNLVISEDATISQVLAHLKSAKEFKKCLPSLELSVTTQEIETRHDPYAPPPIVNVHSTKLSKPLGVFSSRGGLSIIARQLPTVYAELPPRKDSTTKKVKPNDAAAAGSSSACSSQTNSTELKLVTTVPQHSLAAFGLFLKLAAYAEYLSTDMTKTVLLLRLLLGESSNGDKIPIYWLPEAESLAAFPFEVVRKLLDNTETVNNDGVLLRRLVFEAGAMHLMLNCLETFSHQVSQSAVPGAHELQGLVRVAETSEKKATRKESSEKHYWPKGTGYASGMMDHAWGSLNKGKDKAWEPKMTADKHTSDERQVCVILEVLSSYINPGDIVPEDFTKRLPFLPDVPPIFSFLMEQSCLIAALCSYLRNDSILDIKCHIKLYCSILRLIRAMALADQLSPMLTKKVDQESETTIAKLLESLMHCVNQYVQRLNTNKNSSKIQTKCWQLDDTDDDGLAVFINQVTKTSQLVQYTISSNAKPLQEKSTNTQETFVFVPTVPKPVAASPVTPQKQQKRKEKSITAPPPMPTKDPNEERYMAVMKKYKFDTFDMITFHNDNPDKMTFTVPYRYADMVKKTGTSSHPTRVKRLAQESATLSTSLPLSYNSSVFVRCDTDRLDVMKVLITGPADSPYANGCFEFDIFFPTQYPTVPMNVNLQTTGRGSVRFNPNLYNCGKVCLSILNTWSGSPEEKWNSRTSSLLQVLVSIQSLILVSEPYFNEPGYERNLGTSSGNKLSRDYNNTIRQATVRWAMIDQLQNPSPCFKSVIQNHFWLKRDSIRAQVNAWVTEMDSGKNATVMRDLYRQLCTELDKLEEPTDDVAAAASSTVEPMACGNDDEPVPSTSGSNGSSSVPMDVDLPTENLRKHTDQEIFGAMEEELQEELNTYHALEDDDDDDDDDYTVEDDYEDSDIENDEEETDIFVDAEDTFGDD